MDEALYFLPKLMKASRQQDTETAFEGAFRQIAHLGRRKQYTQGFLNFVRFMEEACLHHATVRDDCARFLLVQTIIDDVEAIGEAEKDLSARLSSHLDWRTDYETLQEEADKGIGGLPPITVQLVSDKAVVGEVTLQDPIKSRWIDGVKPGRYTLRLDTGLVIWEGQFTADHLIWTAAPGRRHLELAAETEESRRRPSCELVLGKGALALRTFPGIEHGSLEIELANTGASRDVQ